MAIRLLGTFVQFVPFVGITVVGLTGKKIIIDMNTIKTEELKQKLEKNKVVLIEVLDEEEYNKSHIKGAVNIPLKRISTEARKRYQDDEEIVVYCSDKECTASPTAAKKLKESGFKNIYHYKGGKKEWKESGLPMES